MGLVVSRSGNSLCGDVMEVGCRYWQDRIETLVGISPPKTR